jgi:hypothetical protein
MLCDSRSEPDCDPVRGLKLHDQQHHRNNGWHVSQHIYVVIGPVIQQILTGASRRYSAGSPWNLASGRLPRSNTTCISNTAAVQAVGVRLLWGSGHWGERQHDSMVQCGPAMQWGWCTGEGYR